MDQLVIDSAASDPLSGSSLTIETLGPAPADPYGHAVCLSGEVEGRIWFVADGGLRVRR